MHLVQPQPLSVGGATRSLSQTSVASASKPGLEEEEEEELRETISLPFEANSRGWHRIRCLFPLGLFLRELHL